MRDRKHVLLVLVLLAFALMSVLFVTACGSEEPATTTTAAGGGANMGEDIVVGAINSITGVNALTGAEQKWAQERAAADYNAKGGIKLADGKMHKIVLKFADDKSSDTEAASAMEKLIKSENIKLILSSNTTPYNQAAATIAEQYGAFFQMNTSWIDDPGFIGGMKLKWSADVFEYAAQAGLAAIGAAKNLPEAITKFAVMTENNPDGIGFGDGTVAGLKAEGWDVVAYEKFVEGQKDFSSIILKFKEAGVEGLVVLISPADGITFVKQLKEQGWAPKFMFGFKGFWPVEFMKGLAEDSDYICNDGFWSETLPYPGAKELGAAFSAEHNGDTSVSIGLPYATATILFDAIQAAGSIDPAAVKAKIFGQTFKGTVMGDIVYGGAIPGDDGIAHIPFLAFQWKDGKRTVVAPTALATGKTQVMLPWDKR
jgi:branched-chain amino acid transport system substrate-binding protein